MSKEVRDKFRMETLQKLYPIRFLNLHIQEAIYRNTSATSYSKHSERMVTNQGFE